MIISFTALLLNITLKASNKEEEWLQLTWGKGATLSNISTTAKRQAFLQEKIDEIPKIEKTASEMFDHIWEKQETQWMLRHIATYQIAPWVLQKENVKHVSLPELQHDLQDITGLLFLLYLLDNSSLSLNRVDLNAQHLIRKISHYAHHQEIYLKSFQEHIQPCLLLIHTLQNHTPFTVTFLEEDDMEFSMVTWICHMFLCRFPLTVPKTFRKSYQLCAHDRFYGAFDLMASHDLSGHISGALAADLINASLPHTRYTSPYFKHAQHKAELPSALHTIAAVALTLLVEMYDVKTHTKTLSPQIALSQRNLCNNMALLFFATHENIPFLCTQMRTSVWDSKFLEILTTLDCFNYTQKFQAHLKAQLEISPSTLIDCTNETFAQYGINHVVWDNLSLEEQAQTLYLLLTKVIHLSKNPTTTALAQTEAEKLQVSPLPSPVHLLTHPTIPFCHIVHKAGQCVIILPKPETITTTHQSSLFDQSLVYVTKKISQLLAHRLNSKKLNASLKHFLEYAASQNA